jgi:hypothetical protein
MAITPKFRRTPKPDRVAALELLASCKDGCLDGLMIARGFTIEHIVELVRAGLASEAAKRAFG